MTSAAAANRIASRRQDWGFCGRFLSTATTILRNKPNFGRIFSANPSAEIADYANRALGFGSACQPKLI
jgi:hypothetical protein